MVSKKNDNRSQNSIGQYFTPDYIAKFMVKNIKHLIEDSNDKSNVSLNLNNLKILEPAVGEGIFLKHLLENDFSDITAYEIDPSLKEKLFENYPQIKFRFENFLGSDPNEKFDLIVGNPPYLGQNYNAELFQDLVKKFPLCAEFFVGNMDLFYYFIHLGINKLNPGGFLSFITTNYWITKSKKTGIKLLKPHILNECFLIQYIDLSNISIFRDATGQHNCIFVLQKKTNKEKLDHSDHTIDIIQVKGKQESNQITKQVISPLLEGLPTKYLINYQSALTNNNLNKRGSWNLIFPKEVKDVVDKIEKVCLKDGKITFLKDLFFIRNGLILIKDSIFVLKLDENLKIENDKVSIKIADKFVLLNESEKNRLKRIYKSKSIKPYGYELNDFIGFLIYFNKDESKNQDIKNRNFYFEKKYPNLTDYIKQYESKLKDILINAKENSNDIYFPRRGSFILRNETNSKPKIINLEDFYDNSQKIFFKYISDRNIFGYSNTSYYATSDTYFLWPKVDKKNLDYPFLLAYLNSNLVNFLFKAKNISIKRSKTKLEDGLPIPNLNISKFKEASSIISDIRSLSSWLIYENSDNDRIFQYKLKLECFSSNQLFSTLTRNKSDEILSAMTNKDSIFIQRLIENLFFQLFDLNEKEINQLMIRYYSS